MTCLTRIFLPKVFQIHLYFLAIQFRPFGFLAPKDFYNYLALSIPDEGYSTNILCALLSTFLLYPRSPKGEGGILFYLCPSFHPSKIFFVTFFSVTVDGRNLIFGHKRHIGIPYCG